MKCNRTQEECAKPGVCLELGCQGKLAGECDGGRQFLEQARENLRQLCDAKSSDDGTRGRIEPVPPVVPNRLREGADKIRAKLKEDRALFDHYVLHCHMMLKQLDMHGLWDAAVNGSEVSNRIDRSLEALAALGEAE